MRREEARLRELGLWPPQGLVPVERQPTIPAPVSRGTPSQVAATGAAASAIEGDIAMLDWAALEATVRTCQACAIGQTRKQAVPGGGDRRARLLVVGGAPGAEDDQRGEPLVGPAGELFEQMLLAIGLDRRRVFITSALKCRPSGSHDPGPDPLAACSPYLARQVALLQPAAILALGAVAARALLGGDGGIDAWRGADARHAGIPVVVSEHPAQLLRSPVDKLRAWEDLCRLHDVLAASGTSSPRAVTVAGGEPSAS